jgi:hypothetical protein
MWEGCLGARERCEGSMTFMLDGKQYVIFTGKNGANGATATSRVYAFVLDGKTPMP